MRMTQTHAPALQLDDLHKSFGKAEIIRGIDLSIGTCERHAIIGPNGAGKSTLFNLITGTVSTNLRQGQSAWSRPGRACALPDQPHGSQSQSFQITNIFPNMTVFENVRCALLWSQGLQVQLLEPGQPVPRPDRRGGSRSLTRST